MGLSENLGRLSPEEARTARLLARIGQEHLFAAWPDPGIRDADKRRLLAQAAALDRQYPGGLAAYVDNARKLLADAAAGANPFEGARPAVPRGVVSEPGSPDFASAEAEGLAQAGAAAFVLVAGGLGERLGHPGIKVALPVELATGRSFLELYIRHILAFERAADPDGSRNLRLPLAIMTSDDTHGPTAAFLERNRNFGMESAQILLVKQEKVPSLVDAQARFALCADDPFRIETKPHGHGDVHSLLHLSGLAARWKAEGRKWVVFFQDTNALSFRAIPAALGVSSREGLHMNSLAVPRRAKEAAGGIVEMRFPGGRVLTVNVEYNQLDPLLRATVNPEGDVPDASGFSPYPCNINVLVFSLGPYEETLRRHGGAVPEFVNPKYADAARTVFKKPTRLECMMQDYPRQLASCAGVGFTRFDRWVSFSAVKNSLEEAAAKARAGLPPEGAGSGEMDWYAAGRRFLELCGWRVERGPEREFGGLLLSTGPVVSLDPLLAPTLEALRRRLKGGRISGRSALVIEGAEVEVEDLDLDGALVIRAAPGARVIVRRLVVRNAGWSFVPLAAGADAPPELRMRAYRLEKTETRVLEFGEPGEHVVGEG